MPVPAQEVQADSLHPAPAASSQGGPAGVQEAAGDDPAVGGRVLRPPDDGAGGRAVPAPRRRAAALPVLAAAAGPRPPPPVRAGLLGPAVAAAGPREPPHPRHAAALRPRHRLQSLLHLETPRTHKLAVAGAVSVKKIIFYTSTSRIKYFTLHEIFSVGPSTG